VCILVWVAVCVAVCVAVTDVGLEATAMCRVLQVCVAVCVTECVVVCIAVIDIRLEDITTWFPCVSMWKTHNLCSVPQQKQAQWHRLARSTPLAIFTHYASLLYTFLILNCTGEWNLRLCTTCTSANMVLLRIGTIFGRVCEGDDQSKTASVHWHSICKSRTQVW